MVLVHIDFVGDRRVIGRSIVIGRMIFSIVEGLGCEGGRSRVFGLRLLVWLGQHQPHMLRKLV